jgi:putative FmdB family regulatory protein
MPTYDYECPHCGHAFEFSQKMTDEPLKKCPKCKKGVKRLIGTGSGVIFKGKGFYATDYRKGSKPCSEAKSKGCDACPHNK